MGNFACGKFADPISWPVLGTCGDSSKQGRQSLVLRTVRYKVFERNILGGKQKQMVRYYKVLLLKEEVRGEVFRGEGRGNNGLGK